LYSATKREADASSEWFVMGRPNKVDPEDIASYILSMPEGPQNRKSMSCSELHDIIRNMHVKKCVEEQNMQETDVKPLSANTIYRLANKVRASDKFNIFSKVSNKNETRYAAENSERSTIQYTMVVAASHFFPGTLDRNIHVPYERMTENSKLMYDLVKSQHPEGTSLVHVLPELVTTTDEITVFATIGKINDSEGYYVTIKPEKGTRLPQSNTRSVYTTTPQGNRHCQGIRIVINHTFSAAGKVAPIAATIYGLSCREMPDDEDIVCIPIAGLV
jgi:hypothetical protein